TLQGLSALGLPDLTVSTSNVAAATDGSVRFDLHFQATLTTTTTLGNLGGADQGVVGAGGVSVPLTAALNFDLSFGLSGTTFYVKLPPGGVALTTRIDASGVSLPVRVGLLSAQVESGSVEMHAQTTLAVRDANNDGLLTLRRSFPASSITLNRWRSARSSRA